MTKFNIVRGHRVLRVGLAHINSLDSTRTYASQCGDGASSDCCWLKSVPQVCDSDVVIITWGRSDTVPVIW